MREAYIMVPKRVESGKLGNTITLDGKLHYRFNIVYQLVDSKKPGLIH